MIRPWVVLGCINGLDQSCIIDSGCNLTAVPISLVNLLKPRIQRANIQVTLADGNSYKPKGLVSVAITVSQVIASVDALVSSGDKVLLGLDWMSKVVVS